MKIAVLCAILIALIDIAEKAGSAESAAGASFWWLMFFGWVYIAVRAMRMPITE